ncbi:T9SS type A sorting domain-containing protein [Flavobacterium orientale]|uniref:Secretion system C-terminal sorting domain-containing protein n=1 Tax=Flavobacterium orientale TaxID=1756020 RepID=A0A917DAI5_9FLAO|nr:T9SS type A sorting domain-containing protein [Flavobacterium orientale]GGD20343.1 hypothetical protein GCM10011343_08600 [Flavobacterium orientale]
MKKLLLSLLMVSSTLAFSQVLKNENFNTFTVGNIGTDLTGVTAGQGGWFTFNQAGGTNGGNNNYQVVVEGGVYGNVFQFTGSDAAPITNASGGKFMWQNDLTTVWATRTAGNNIIEIEFDYFTGPTTASTNSFRLYIYSAEAAPRVLAGIGITKNATVSSVAYPNVVNGFGHWTSTPGTGTYSFGLGPNATTPISLTANTWVKLGFSFNVTTGQIRWKGPGFDASFSGSVDFPVTTAGTAPGEIDFIALAGTANTVASVSKFDNYLVKASNADTLLSIDDQALVSSEISAYPNPTKDSFVIDTNDLGLVNSISLTDINGRVVKNITFDGVSGSTNVDISDLNSGMYLLTVKTDNGVGTTKIIKN